MLDRVREALFSTLGDRIEGSRVLDLYAGSGSLGLEALSRGASLARMVERDPATLAVLRGNVAKLCIEGAAHTLRGDALSQRSWHASPARGERFGHIFVDPPYAEMERPGGRASILAAVRSLVLEHLEPGGVLVLHTPRRCIEGRDFGPGLEVDLREYGATALWYVEPAEPEAAP